MPGDGKRRQKVETERNNASNQQKELAFMMLLRFTSSAEGENRP